MKNFNGLAAAKGMAMGEAIFFAQSDYEVKPEKIDDVDAEIKRLSDARADYQKELDDLYEDAVEKFGEEGAGILLAYKEITDDDSFFDEAIDRVRDEKISLAYAVEELKKDTVAMFLEMDDEYMRDRSADIANVCDAIIKKMLGIENPVDQVKKTNKDFIVVADDLAPADTVRLDKNHLKGFVTQKGGVTSHTVILAKTLGIPAVVSVGGILKEKAKKVFIDGTSGRVVLDPDEEIEKEFGIYQRKIQKRNEIFCQIIDKPAKTPDGHEVEIAQNIGDIESIDSLDMSICDGIGLFRTEFLYMEKKTYPTEDEQYAKYRQVAEAGNGKNIIIRTLDIGGDKQLDYLDLSIEDNPFLGFRAIRICLEKTEMFKTQLCAILRASAYGKISIMFPMIVTLEELRRAKEILEECKAELDARGKKYDKNIGVGIMIETPAAVLLSEMLAKEADFFSIGTNDLIQYVTASDRMNGKTQYLYTICNMSVLRAIRFVAKNGHANGIPVNICGEAASDEMMTPIWLSLGIDELSMVAGQIPLIKYIINNTSKEQADEITKKVFDADNIEDIKKILEENLKRFNEVI